MMATHTDASGADEQDISVYVGSKARAAGTMAC
jgi:hypothetical protein